MTAHTRIAMLYLRLIWRQLKIVGAHLKTIGKIVWSFAKSHKIVSSIVAAALATGLGAAAYFGASKAATTIAEGPAVHLVRVGDVSASAPISLIGIVRATREANVAPDISGTVSAVYRNLGDYVPAGTIIAELKNDTQRAAVAAARAALQKAQSGSVVGGISVENAQNSYAAAIDTARSTVQSAYSTIDDAIARKADQTFSNPNSPQPHFNVSSSNSQLVVNVQNDRLAMQAIRARESTVVVATLSPGDLLAELSLLGSEVKSVQNFMQDLVAALNAAVPTYGITEATIAGYRADVSAGLASINALASSLPGVSEMLKTKRAAVDIAQTSLATGSTGESADVAAAEANLALQLAGLEKTLIRAPISGTVNRLDLDVGSFVNASVPIVYITSAGGLEVVAFVSGNDIADIAVGAKAKVGASVDGVVARVASALDPLTKKAEVRVFVPPSAPLVAGQSATVSVERSAPKVPSANPTLTVPLTAIKITPQSPLVFTVNDAHQLVGNPVVLGTLRGDSVDIVSGVTATMQIVEDARGLKEGQAVIVNP